MPKKFDFGKAFRFEIKSPKVPKFPKLTESPIFSAFFEKLIAAPQLVSDFRIKILSFVILALTGVLFFRIFYLQVIEGGKNFERAKNNRLVFEKITAPRGIIYDRMGVVLAENKPIFKLVKNGKVEIVTKEQALELEAEGLANEAPNSGPLGKIEIDLVRGYQSVEAFSHLLGFTSEISVEELKKLSNYSLGDRIGKLGLEANLENFLRGIDGRYLTEVNAKGEIVNILGTTAPAAGKNVTLTVDAGLQQKVFDELTSQIQKVGAVAGAATASNPATGEILALVSYPSFDANLLSFGITQEELDKLNTNPGKPFLNRVTQGNYPPGSIFKLVSAVAGLETEAITETTKFEDTGEIFLGTFRFPNWNFICCGKTEGLLDVVAAIARSNDIFFYRVGEKVGVESLKDWGEKLGLGKPTGVELPEVDGLVPSPEWKLRVKNEPWFPGNTLHMAIGQGDVLTTPLQLNMLTSFFANGGKIYKPFLVSKITEIDEKTILSFKSKLIAENLVSKKNLELVREGMRTAASTGGTAWPFHDFKIQCGAKTGTAEAGVENPHAWFTVFCPYEQPEIVLTILIEEAGEGSSISGPVARKVIEWYFERNK